MMVKLEAPIMIAWSAQMCVFKKVGSGSIAAVMPGHQYRNRLMKNMVLAMPITIMLTFLKRSYFSMKSVSD